MTECEKPAARPVAAEAKDCERCADGPPLCPDHAAPPDAQPEAVCDCYKSACRCTCHGGGLVRHFVDAQPEAQEIVLHKPDEGDEFAWTQCDGPDDICSDPRQSENWQHAVAVLRRKP